MDDRDIRNTLGNFCTGVVIATGFVDGKPAGFAAQSFLSLSLDPALVGLSPAKTSTSWPLLRESGSFCINILSSHQKPVCDRFAQSGVDKFEGLEWQSGVTGSPVLADVLAYIDCELVAEHDAGDHTIAVGHIKELKVCKSEGLPLLFFKGAYGAFSVS
ncbi:MAG: flavin reductase family protein [Pseudomonadales bacterium]|nr:flavin reductase family protein [Pseudomonadales bacterium]